MKFFRKAFLLLAVFQLGVWFAAWANSVDETERQLSPSPLFGG